MAHNSFSPCLLSVSGCVAVSQWVRWTLPCEEQDFFFSQILYQSILVNQLFVMHFNAHEALYYLQNLQGWFNTSSLHIYITDSICFITTRVVKCLLWRCSVENRWPPWSLLHEEIFYCQWIVCHWNLYTIKHERVEKQFCFLNAFLLLHRYGARQCLQVTPSSLKYSISKSHHYYIETNQKRHLM